MRHLLPPSLGAGALLVALGWPAAATEVPNPRLCSPNALENCLDGVGGGVTSLDTLRVTTSARTSDAAREEQEEGQQASLGRPGAQRGMAAGSDDVGGWTVWGGGGYAGYESDVFIAPYEADAYNFLLGADRFFGERFLAGIVLGYENTDVDTLYNGGGQDRDGITVSLYGAFLINDVFSVDGSAGYTALDTDETRLDTGSARAGAPATPGATLFGSYDSDRAFFSLNLNAVKAFGQWVAGGRVGILHAVESQDAYTETGGTGRRTVGDRHVDLTQGYASVDFGYSAGAFEPYVLLEYRNDFSRDDGNSAGGLPGGVRPQPDDDDEFQGGIGVRYFGGNGITGSLEWLRTGGRDDFDSDTVNLSIRAPF